MLGNHITQLRNEPDQLKLTILSAKVGANLVGAQWGSCFPSSLPKEAHFCWPLVGRSIANAEMKLGPYAQSSALIFTHCFLGSTGVN